MEGSTGGNGWGNFYNNAPLNKPTKEKIDKVVEFMKNQYKNMNEHREKELKDSLERLTNLADLKYRAGQKQHGGNLEEKKGLLWKAKEEVIDMWFYLDALEKQIELKTIYTANGVDIDE